MYKPRRFRNDRGNVEYVEMPKVASNSIRRALHSQVRKPNPGAPKLIFTFVRHPLSRFVSAYVEKIQTRKFTALVGWLAASKLSQDMTPAEFIDFLLTYDENFYREQINNHFCPQSWIAAGAPNLNYVGKLENIDEDWGKLMSEYGLAPLEHRHRTKGIPHWSEILDAETEAKARQFYADDFAKWEGWWD